VTAPTTGRVWPQIPAAVAVPTTPPVPAPTPSGGAVAVAAGVESSGSSRSSSGGRPQTRRARMSVPAVEVQTSAFLPPVDALQAADAGVTPGALRAVWVMDSHGTLLHPIGQPVTDPLQFAERVAEAAVLIEQGHAADAVVLFVGQGARHELLHTRALVESLGRSRNQPQDLPGRGPYAAVPR
jgi:hypothetical protein